MPEFINSKIIKDTSINENKKFKSTIYLKKDCYTKIESLIALSGENASRNDVIEKAIDFFFAYTTSQISQDYLCGIFGAKMEGLVGNLASRIQKVIFETQLRAICSCVCCQLFLKLIEINTINFVRKRFRMLREQTVQ